MTTFKELIFPVLMVFITACSAAEGLDGQSELESGAPQGTRCGPNNKTLACTCDDAVAGPVPGRQVCSAGVWSDCTCIDPATGSSFASSSAGGPDPGGNRSATRFDWLRTAPSGGSCEPGHYEGTFDGMYGPSIIVVSDLKVVPVFPIDLPDNPGLAFDLTREGKGEIYTVSNGKMNGNALALFPFTADIVGKLDCDTLKFDAKIVNGTYIIGVLPFGFEGPLIADYDKQTHTFINGTWNVTEPAYPTAGGSGTWTVQFKHP